MIDYVLSSLSHLVLQRFSAIGIQSMLKHVQCSHCKDIDLGII